MHYLIIYGMNDYAAYKYRYLQQLTDPAIVRLHCSKQRAACTLCASQIPVCERGCGGRAGCCPARVMQYASTGAQEQREPGLKSNRGPEGARRHDHKAAR